MVHEFWPFQQRKAHRELDPGDFVRVQGHWYIIDQIRRWRRPFDYDQDDGDQDVQLTQLTGSMTKRFQHIDKFAVDPDATCPLVQVVLSYRGTDVTGQQYGHAFWQYNANRLAPYELNNCSFSTEDIIRVVVTFADGETGIVTLWFSGEEYTLVNYKPPEEYTIDYKPPVKAPREPSRFVVVSPYGFSRVMTLKEFKESGMDASLRT